MAEAGRRERGLAVDWMAGGFYTGDLPGSYTVDDDSAGGDGGQGGNLLDDEDGQQLRDVVAVRHVGFAFVVESREELIVRRVAFFEFGDLVELRAGHGDVGLGVVFRGGLAEFRVEEAGEEGHGDNVGGDGLLVIFGHSECSCP